MNYKNEMFFENQDVFSLDKWEKEGRPLMWIPVEEKYNYRVDFDTAYGAIRLMIFSVNKYVEVNRGKDFLAYNDIIVLNKNVYGLENYLYIPMEKRRK